MMERGQRNPRFRGGRPVAGPLKALLPARVLALVPVARVVHARPRNAGNRSAVYQGPAGAGTADSRGGDPCLSRLYGHTIAAMLTSDPPSSSDCS